MKIDGVVAVADLLNRMEASDRERLLADIEKRDPALASQIQEQMFVFDNLIKLEDRSIQILLREIPQGLLAVALRKASHPVSEAVFKNLSARAAEALRDEMSSSPPRKLSDVETAQSQIITIAKRLIAEGKIQ